MMLKKLIRNFKAAYLLFLVIPATWVFFMMQDQSAKVPEAPDYLYFSARSSQPARLLLLNEGVSIAEEELKKGSFHYFDCSFPEETPDILTFRIEGLQAGDTLSLTPLNLYSRNKVFFSIGDQLMPDLQNLSIAEEEAFVSFIVTGNDQPCTFSIQKPQTEDIMNGAWVVYFWTIMLFAALFLLLIVLAPPLRYFIPVFLFSLAVMFPARTYLPESTGKISISAEQSLENAECYFSISPQFNSLKRVKFPLTEGSTELQADLYRNPFLRIDLPASGEAGIQDIRTGLGPFGAGISITDMKEGRVVLNDLMISGNRLISSGPDPFIALSSARDAAQTEQLKAGNSSLFLYIALFIFQILISLHYLLAPYAKGKFRPLYLLILLLPLLWHLINGRWNPEPKAFSKDYFCFSASSQQGATLSLFAGQDSVTSWSLNTPAWKMLDALGRISDSTGLSIKVYARAGDTVRFTGFSYFSGTQHNTLYDPAPPFCYPVRAGGQLKNGVLSLSPESSDPVVLSLVPSTYWEKPEDANMAPGILIFLVLIAAAIIILLSPSPRFFLICLLIALPATAIYSWTGNDFQDQMVIRTSAHQRSVEAYYSKTPVFSPENKFPAKSGNHEFITLTEMRRMQYFRCDLDPESKEAGELNITLRSGFLNHQWNLIPGNENALLLNDLAASPRGWNISGPDPFVALLDTGSSEAIQQLRAERMSGSLILSIIILLVLVSLRKTGERFPPAGFIITALFIIIISHTLLFRVFNSDRARLIIEKRDAAAVPGFRTDSLRTTADAMSAYFGDQLCGRNRIIPLNNALCYSAFGELIYNPNVYFGRDGWFFYIGANGRETYENRQPVSAARLERIRLLLEERRDWLASQGTELYLFFPRTSAFIYEDKLGPRLFRYHKKSKLDQLMEYLAEHSSLNIIDVGKPLVEARDTAFTDLYYRKATHWNYYGAWFAYHEVMNSIRADHPECGEVIPLEEIRWLRYPEPRKDMDLIHMAALTGYVMGEEIKPLHPKVNRGDTLEYHPLSDAYDVPRLCIRNRESRGPRMLMFHDSYARYLMPYLNGHFRQSTYLWTPAFSREAVLQEKPDVVIWEMTERFIPFYFLYRNKFFKDEDRIRAGGRGTDAAYITLERYY